ncbi:MAG: hypothetical protein B0D96_03540 [Candidatus Sedimenticola endophacoides]|uniref:Histidine kinase n=2 Tax=Candidatus Sedimenticola endophacoides TaxID=2548426 RepID=A0A6N4DPT2_9GAMM|nr:MAG: hypothetical protein B0D94_12255 [Candidatus Sedimenticola endophacoides]OQX36721.1 MAG: hypothetical protein B0D96_03540 [Candidatus Sedimenticola endophacoides]OQX39652.1 MAG: hypothetical protein B0D89_10225 [Candidatus Sedimenticola endophacoides]OQX47637.1 MAG: hypothetical protein B0D87_09050 [Candidatus Sedimenticola endophacoides]PUD99017.1 MAG: hypothetical protein C3L24_11680 [Candidatus Sedimenticola endophacoides]
MEQSLHRFYRGGWDRTPDPALDSPSTLVLLFVAAPPEGEVASALADLTGLFPRSVVVGCSSSGEIYGQELSDGSLVAAVVRFEHTRLRRVSCAISSADQSAEAGRELAGRLRDEGLSAVFTLTDGLLVNGSVYVEALDSALPREVVVTGGLAGDGDRFERTWVIEEGVPVSGRAVAVGLYGDALRVAHGSRGGWDLLGPEREVTRAEGNVLYALDGQPALQIYTKYLGERASGLPATGLLFPLAIRNEEEADGLTVRTILGVDPGQHSITFAGDIPEGCLVRLMRANFDRLIDGAAGAAEDLDLEGYADGPLLCVAISCVGRRLVLGPRVEEEIESVAEGLPASAGLIGYYSYGEISPLASGRCDLHNQTMTLTCFWERA